MNARPNISDWQHAENLKTLSRLRSEGQEITYSAQGYFVRGVGGATTLKPPHGRYAEANRRDNLNAAIRQALNAKPVGA
jgi:hypothetical protein